MVETRSKSMTKMASKIKRTLNKKMIKTRSKSLTKIKATAQIKQISNKKDQLNIIRQTNRCRTVQKPMRSVIRTRHHVRSSVRLLNKKIKKMRKTILDLKKTRFEMKTNRRKRQINQKHKNGHVTKKEEDSVIFLGLMKIKKPKTVKRKCCTSIRRQNKLYRQSKARTVLESPPSVFTKMKTEFPNFKKFVRYINQKMPKRRQSQISIITIHSDSSEINKNLEDSMSFPELDSADQRYLDEILKMVNPEELEKFNEYAANIQHQNTPMNINSYDGDAASSQQTHNYFSTILPSDFA